MRKNVSTDKNAALGFRAETFVTALLNHVEQVSVVLSAVTVANTVETSEVGAGFRRCNDVVDRNAEVGFFQFDIHQNSTQIFIYLQCGIDGVSKGRSSFINPSARHTDPPVSVAVAAGVSRAATQEAEPPEEPPGTTCSFQGLNVFP